MGIDVGFDIYPPLEGPDDADLWNMFLSKVILVFQSDPVLVQKEDCLEFQVGEHPILYLNPTRFRRFSSKISGRCSQAEHYIYQVCRVAKEFFHDRIHFWSELGIEPQPKYTWSEVYAAGRQDEMAESNVDADSKPGSHAEETSGDKSSLKFQDVCGWVLHAWERTHVGMNGLRFVSALFPPDDGYE